MSNKVKDTSVKLRKEPKTPKVSTTEALDRFMNFTMQNLRILDNNDKIFENRINYLLTALATETIEEDDITDSDTFVSHFFIDRDNKLYKIKLLTDGYQAVPQEKPEGAPEDWSPDPNKYTFQKEDITVEIIAPSPKEAIEELKTRIRASKNIQIVKG